MTFSLADLADTGITGPIGAAAVTVSAVTADSRKAGPGTVFVALSGSRADGAAFAADAVARGAVAVIVPPGRDLPGLGVPVIAVDDPRRTLSLLARKLDPGQPAVTVAVTGTSGKTSVAEFTRQLFAACGRRSASLGTIGVVTSDGARYGSLTTPDPVALHRSLAALAGDGITHLAMEASSHGLDQRRLDGVELTAAAFTNLGRDHLDYHADMEAYFAAKARLFDTLLPAGRAAVIDADGDYARRLDAICRGRGHRIVSTGRRGADLRLATVRRDGFAQRIDVEAGGRHHDLRLPLIGEYQASNALVAAGLAIAAGEPLERVMEAIPHLAGVRGRLEVVGEAQGGLAVVDYAHKPDALAAALAALRPFATGRLVCVFGCGGDRDRGKRPIMGRIAVEKADVAIVTDDNPRSENPAAIRAEILAAAPGAREIGDRAQAIRAAISAIRPGDVVLVAGKGHEEGQIIGDRTLPFSDHAVVAAALEEMR